MAGIDPEWAWGGATGSGVRVAVIDSGIEADHPDLGDSVDAGAGVAISIGEEGEVVEVEGPHDDLFGHGTACAGAIHTIAPEARITSVRVLNARLGGKSAVFLRGLAWASWRKLGKALLRLPLTGWGRERLVASLVSLAHSMGEIYAWTGLRYAYYLRRRG